MNSNTNWGIRGGVPPFLMKLLNMIEDPATDHLITWTKLGNSFVIKDHLEFTQEILPKYYKHRALSSFVRQLNTYGFHKVTPARGRKLKGLTQEMEFLHPSFSRGRPSLMQNIKRKKRAVPEQSLSNSGNSICSDLETALEEIKKLLGDMREGKEIQDTMNIQVKLKYEKLLRTLSLLGNGYTTQLNAVKREKEMMSKRLSVLESKYASQEREKEMLTKKLTVIENEHVAMKRELSVLRHERATQHHIDFKWI